MRPTDIIMKKRLGEALTKAEIEAFVRGAVDGSFEDYQLSAMLMAICIRGMDDRETVDLTMAMAHSGDMLDLSALGGPTVDKHSTGGVGDTTTLIAAPLAAACGAKVAKMSGRGLGFTGGTLDKLESIPGMGVSLTSDQFIDQVRRIGLAVIGQTAELAPADKTLYALRDVTATVDSVPLITASILSKKIAAGCGAVVLDVKTGSGALMPTEADSVRLAETMVRIGNMTGRRFSALVTDMDQPLGMYIGNALEVEEAVKVLRGEAAGALKDVSMRLAAQMLTVTGIASGHEEALQRLESALQRGAGLEKLAELIKAQGGDPRVTSDLSLLPHAGASVPVTSASGGYIASIHASDIGNAALALGAGRVKKGDAVDPAAGLIMLKRVGDAVRPGEAWCELRPGAHGDVDAALQCLEGTLTIADSPVTPPRLIHALVDERGTRYL